MTLSRRTFSFASLAALLGGPAVARAKSPAAPATTPSQPAAQNQAPAGIPELDDPPPAPAGLRLDPVVHLEGRAVVLTLAVTNPGDLALPVLTARGSRPAGDPTVSALVDGFEVHLERELGPVDRREFMSRAGPMPVFTELQGHQSLVLGPFRFSLPEGRPPTSFRVTASVFGGEASVSLDRTVTASSKAS